MPQYQDPVYALGYLFDEILDSGSRDNMSAILVTFCNGSDYGINGKNKTFLPGPLYMTRNNEKFVRAYMRNAKDFGHADSPKLRRAAYREDLKFLKKYGMGSLTQQQLQYGKTEKNIIREIEGVIKAIDDMESKQNEDEECGNNQVIPLTQGEHTGSTEIIDGDDRCATPALSDVDGRCDTPALSDGDMDEDENGNEDNDLIQMKKTLTIVPNMIQRSNSMQSIIRRSSSSPTACSDNKKSKRNLKRAFSNMDGSKYNASKRRKSNLGDPIEIV